MSIPQGAIRINIDSNRLEFYAEGLWHEIDTHTPNLGDTQSRAGTRGAFMGGFRDQPVNNTTFDTIDYITITTFGDAIDFGDLNAKLFDGASGVSSGTRQFAVGGRQGPSLTYTNEIKFITYSSTGNSTDLGDLTTSVAGYRPSGFSNSTRGVRAGGSNDPSVGGVNVIDFFTMASTGNAVDFGDTTLAKLRYGTGIASPTRGIIMWGSNHPANVNTMEFVTIATTGNSVDFGDMSSNASTGAAGNATRGLVVTGSSPIELLQMATLGNTIKFGDLSVSRGSAGACSNPTRVVFAGGVDYPAYYNIIDYVSIQTDGNAVDFGDLTVNRHTDNSGSNAHGGL